MNIRRCGILFVEPRERVEFDFESLCSGGDGLCRTREWVALAGCPPTTWLREEFPFLQDLGGDAAAG